MRVGFFGGSFDPPHLGHLAVARAAAETFSLERVLFAPTARQPFKPGGAMASYADRTAMVSLLCQLQPAHARFEVSTLDGPRANNNPNYTVDALAALHTVIGQADSIFAIIGVDAFRGLPHWRSPGTLLQLAEWIVVSRPGVPAPDLQAPNLKATDLAIPSEHRKRIHLLEGVHELATATDIRRLLKSGSNCSGLLPASVLGYIREHRLYASEGKETIGKETTAKP